MNSFKSKLAMFEASATKGAKKPQKEKNSKIKYEGEYVNGIKEGKGKEYLGDKLLFEGEFSQGKRWNGKIKEYDSNGVLLFDGEYKEGEKSGVAKEYKLDGELKFEGVYNKEKDGMAMVLNIMVVKQFLRVYIMKGKNGMEKEKNMTIMIN